jgi:hypothetical protein
MVFSLSEFVALPPNGLPFSCRERAVDHLQKPSDLAREAVSCMGGLSGFAIVNYALRSGSWSSHSGRWPDVSEFGIRLYSGSELYAVSAVIPHVLG